MADLQPPGDTATLLTQQGWKAFGSERQKDTYLLNKDVTIRISAHLPAGLKTVQDTEEVGFTVIAASVEVVQCCVSSLYGVLRGPCASGTKLLCFREGHGFTPTVQQRSQGCRM